MRSMASISGELCEEVLKFFHMLLEVHVVWHDLKEVALPILSISPAPRGRDILLELTLGQGWQVSHAPAGCLLPS
jgi:hypothetical protein